MWAARLWEAATGKEVLRFQVPGHILGVAALSPDGRLAATVTARNDVGWPLTHAICLWETTTGKEVGRLTGQRSLVSALAFTPDGRRLASGQQDGTVLVWDVAGQARKAAGPANALDADELEALWADLARDDAAKAYRAMWRLAASPSEAVPFLKRRLTPAVGPTAAELRRWLADLDSDQFPVREAATRQLLRWRDQVEPLLREAKGSPSAEVRKRADAIRKEPSRIRSAETLRGLRALEALEKIGSREARQVLKAMAGGDPRAPETRDAKAALGRLKAVP